MIIRETPQVVTGVELSNPSGPDGEYELVHYANPDQIIILNFNGENGTQAPEGSTDKFVDEVKATPVSYNSSEASFVLDTSWAAFGASSLKMDAGV